VGATCARPSAPNRRVAVPTQLWGEKRRGGGAFVFRPAAKSCVFGPGVCARRGGPPIIRSSPLVAGVAPFVPSLPLVLSRLWWCPARPLEGPYPVVCLGRFPPSPAPPPSTSSPPPGSRTAPPPPHPHHTRPPPPTPQPCLYLWVADGVLLCWWVIVVFQKCLGGIRRNAGVSCLGPRLRCVCLCWGSPRLPTSPLWSPPVRTRVVKLGL